MSADEAVNKSEAGTEEATRTGTKTDIRGTNAGDAPIGDTDDVMRTGTKTDIRGTNAGDAPIGDTDDVTRTGTKTDIRGTNPGGESKAPTPTDRLRDGT